jgi:hypothetical protein
MPGRRRRGSKLKGCRGKESGARRLGRGSHRRAGLRETKFTIGPMNVGAIVIRLTRVGV